ncbi:MAG: tRNA 2-selenouridine(34) synthase MnmH [Bacteroidia bacterium]
MMKVPDQIGWEEFMAQAEFLPVVDVRSPVEYNKGHVPGAVNVPLFEDSERAEIGTIYKLRGKDDAVLRGLELVSPKLADFIKSVKKLDTNSGKVLVYCFRGGMRSNSFATLLTTAGINAEVLQGGYKSFRKHSLEFYLQKLPLMILGGATGSGKTDILRELKAMGEQVVDLEGIANHKGSAFGAIGQEAQPQQQQFENLLYRAFSKLDLTKTIWLEDESFSIGKLKIPYPLWLQMKQATIISIAVPFDLRVDRLIAEYGAADKQTLEAIILRIQKRLGGLGTKEALESLEMGDAKKVTSLLLKYYDSAYAHDHEKREMKNIIKLETTGSESRKNAELILEFLQANPISHEAHSIQ